MKYIALVIVFLAAFACMKKEETPVEAAPAATEQEAAAQEGHNADHEHVTEGADHDHEDAHHQ